MTTGIICLITAVVIMLWPYPDNKKAAIEVTRESDDKIFEASLLTEQRQENHIEKILLLESKRPKIAIIAPHIGLLSQTNAISRNGGYPKRFHSDAPSVNIPPMPSMGKLSYLMRGSLYGKEVQRQMNAFFSATPKVNSIELTEIDMGGKGKKQSCRVAWIQSGFDIQNSEGDLTPEEKNLIIEAARGSLLILTSVPAGCYLPGHRLDVGGSPFRMHWSESKEAGWISLLDDQGREHLPEVYPTSPLMWNDLIFRWNETGHLKQIERLVADAGKIAEQDGDGWIVQHFWLSY